MNKNKLTPELCEKLIHSATTEFQKFYPTYDPMHFTTNMSNIMIILGYTDAPISTVEFREALRACANILEVLYSDETN